MTIEYKTEGKCVIPCKDEVCDTFAISWVKGGNKVLLQSNKCTVEISKSQLLQIGNLADSISDDIQPRMNSLPRPA